MLLFFTGSIALRLILMIPLLGLIIGGVIRAVQNNFGGIPWRLIGSLVFLQFYFIWLLRSGSAIDTLICTLISYGVIVGLWAWSSKTEKEEHIEWNPSELIRPHLSHHSEDELKSPTVVSLSEKDRQLLRDVRDQIWQADDD